MSKRNPSPVLLRPTDCSHSLPDSVAPQRVVAAIAPGARRCPECKATRQPGRWRDPYTAKEFAAVMEHKPSCSVYLTRAIDRRDTTAHLRAFGRAS